ncbi:MAG: cysteine synthase [Azospira oryzae]|uniref:Cysteine synthase family protein n=1 Tax=Pelomicrobium methylotrophicum TaxID=2602750 RepID=A0A5C7EJ09_9PROT|nr:cysteine synthase family protein [Pelomicrobium methylotrophicum]PZP60930.1 MAG: cysteine synthase [Azospira oryzae]PZP80846.1 MAG: cysteine synthase [Azospira oryzae]TXF12395.1 cysteine synthase family protein [Pelomicrobium methylotrophicum]
MKPQRLEALASHPLVARIGATPLVEIELAREAGRGVRLFAKLESVNPGGSIKDRPVARMLMQAVADGRLTEGRRLLDSSSGNAGISYAMLGAALGIPVTIVVPGNASEERLARIAAHGAELIVTDPLEGYDFALQEAKRLAETYPDRYWYCDQYSNPANWRAHYEATGGEILAQLAQRGLGPPDAFVAGVGTGGTITGVGRRLKEARRDVHVAAVIPETFPGIEGLKPLGHPGDIVPSILDEAVIDERMSVTLDDAVAVCRQLACEGLFVGPSSGAYVYGALQLATTGRFRTLVTILNDTGERYVSTGMWKRPTCSTQ